ncbi:DUF4199 domain-containing protein [Muriicola soli]|uniref:DUF4199 domain-containing protein n=1 Tax=Muriicola soli TaxID=2507538 RepID=A0A411E9S5_9FLAO|nr:DUF4199 domain-containing protein [Muriicola soli]QBA64452.1 DUF4199 domain-containing protein [Muriicola soli]
MEQNQPKIGKFSLNYGLILGGISVVFALMLFFVDAHTSQDSTSQIIGIAIAVAVTLWGIFNFKKANGGLLSIGQAIKLGILISLISGVIYVIYMMVLANVLDPEFVTTIAENNRAAAQEAGVMTAAQIEQQYEGTLNYFWFSYPVILILNVIIGLVIGLVGGLIFKKS